MRFDEFAKGYFAAKDRQPFKRWKSEDWKHGYRTAEQLRAKAVQLQIETYNRMYQSRRPK